MSHRNAGFAAERLERVSAMLGGYVERGELPCASAIISRHGVTAYREKFGWQTIENGKALEFDSLFRIASMTKPVTATAAMLLYEEGHFDLNTPISTFLPAFKEMKVLVRRQPDGSLVLRDAETQITFRHLFTHTAGLSYGGGGDELDKLYQEALKAPGDAPETIQGFVSRLAELPLAFEPGTRWRYGFNLDVLGALVEVISGQSLPDFTQERIFAPLGMTDTTFTLNPAQQSRLATLYRRDPESGKLAPREGPAWSVRMWGGGGLFSTLDDYARFAGMLANGGAIEGTRLLSPTTTAMFAINWAAPEALPHFVELAPAIHAGYGYSLGTAVLLDPAPTGRFGNPGEFYWGGAFSTYFWVDPKESLYGLVMTQLDPNWAYPIPWQLKQLTYQALVE